MGDGPTRSEWHWENVTRQFVSRVTLCYVGFRCFPWTATSARNHDWIQTDTWVRDRCKQQRTSGGKGSGVASRGVCLSRSTEALVTYALMGHPQHAAHAAWCCMCSTCCNLADNFGPAAYHRLSGGRDRAGRARRSSLAGMSRVAHAKGQCRKDFCLELRGNIFSRNV